MHILQNRSLHVKFWKMATTMKEVEINGSSSRARETRRFVI